MKLGQCLISLARLSLYSSRPIYSHGFHKTSTLNRLLTGQTSDYGHKSDPETRLDHEPFPSLGMWSYPTNHEHCCIYRVPHRLRRVNPEAYTPQLVLIGPLHHYLKSQALDVTNTKSMGYLNMDKHKKIYLAEFAQKFEDQNTIDEFRRIIKANEETIRASYSESTSWIKSPEFVEMILLDSVFIIEHMLRVKDASSRTEADAGADNKRLRTKKTRDDAHAYYQGSRTEKTGDLIVDDPCLQITVKEDLMLLENQLPYFILEKLFDAIVPRLCPEETLRKLNLGYFGFQSEVIKVNSRFIHFTDLHRCVRVDTLGYGKPSKTQFRCLADVFQCVRKETQGSRVPPKETNIRHMYNAKKLYSAGVKFVVVKDEFSIDVRFESGYLRIPSLWVRDEMELILRNIMALEQCHYPFKAYVCNFVTFLDFLIDCGKDVDFLVEKGILNNWIGEQRSVAEMVNKLCLGIFENESYYADIATKVNAYYECPINRTRALLSRKYFGNLWTGTATVVATLLLVMTLVQTVVSVIDVMQK